MTTDLTVYTQTAQRFADAFGESFQVNVPISKYTSARVGGSAEMMLIAKSAADLQKAVELACAANIRYTIIGGGSNILVSDRGVRGLVIFNKAKQVQFRHSGASVICTAESGMNLSSLARMCISKGLGGLEWAIGVPGTVGGAVVGNSGAHGGDMNDNLLLATVWEPGRGVRTYSLEDMQYEYRNSVFKREQGNKFKLRRVVLSADLKFKPGSTDVIMARADEFNEKRKKSQPGGATMGSMFKNPENYYAGYLIETAGLKGFRCGGASISEKHANFFLNDGTATAEDIRALIAEAWHTVRDRFGVEMELEVELVGDWDY